MKLLLSLALPLYALDQLTKWWVIKNLPFEGNPEPVIPDFFYLCHWANTGAAFGSFHNSNTAFMILSLVALVAIVFFYLRGAFTDKPSRWAAGLLLGGILGNVTDRILHGHVVDFLLVDLHVRFANPWPAFNVADACICIAAGLFILSSFQAEKKEAKDSGA
ncbi:MAG: signal peptidase II [Verrucomicrobiota bacterium]